MKIDIPSLPDLARFAERLAQTLKPGDVLLLSGEMGAGKTTFVSFLAKALGCSTAVSSPSFTLIQHYDGPVRVYHMDLYRLRDSDLGGLDLDSYLERPDAICVVEWAEKLGPWMSKEYLWLEFRYSNSSESRVIEVRWQGEKYAFRV